MAQYLFVYGTLQPGIAPGAIADVVDQLLPVGEGSVRGTVYDLGEYPGARLGPTGNFSAAGRIFGRVFQLPLDANVLPQLDSYEDYDPKSLETSLFLRVLQSVDLVDGGQLSCWMYVYNGSPDISRLIPSGRFVRR